MGGRTAVEPLQTRDSEGVPWMPDPEQGKSTEHTLTPAQGEPPAARQPNAARCSSRSILKALAFTRTSVA